MTATRMQMAPDERRDGTTSKSQWMRRAGDASLLDRTPSATYSRADGPAVVDEPRTVAGRVPTREGLSGHHVIDMVVPAEAKEVIDARRCGLQGRSEDAFL